jgi:hypothetical protein
MEWNKQVSEQVSKQGKKRLKVAVVKLFKLCASLDKEPYKCSNDSKYEYLFDSHLRNYLFELDTPLTYYNKQRQAYGLRKEWRNHLLEIDKVISGSHQERLQELIEAHNNRMQQIEERKKEKQRIEKSKLNSYYKKEDKIKEDKRYELLAKLNDFLYYPYDRHFKCDVCDFYSTSGKFKAHKKEICTECLAEFLSKPVLAWYHNHIKFKAEELKNDLRKAIKNEEFEKEVHEVVKDKKANRIALDNVLESRVEWETFEKDGLVTYYFQLKGTSYEGRESFIEHMRYSTKEYKVWFVREPDNGYDRFAIGVWTRIEGKEHKIGYVPASISEKLSSHLDAGIKLSPIIMDFYTKDYTYRHYMEEINDWRWESDYLETACLKVAFQDNRLMKTESSEKDDLL